MCFATNTNLELWTWEVEQGVIDNMIIFQKPFPGAARAELESQLHVWLMGRALRRATSCWSPGGAVLPVRLGRLQPTYSGAA